MSERYVVKLASGELMTRAGVAVQGQVDGTKMSRAEAYQLAWLHGAVALRLRPSARAAELAKLRGEVEELRDKLKDLQEGYDDLRCSLEARTEERDKLRDERDALAAQLSSLPPDVTDNELVVAVAEAYRRCPSDGYWTREVAKAARRLLRGPVAPARPVEELRKQLAEVTRERDALRAELASAAKRATVYDERADMLREVVAAARPVALARPCHWHYTTVDTGLLGTLRAALAKLDEVKP